MARSRQGCLNRGVGWPDAGVAGVSFDTIWIVTEALICNQLVLTFLRAASKLSPAGFAPGIR
ncbi:hypothetical protein [Alicyclobacillus sp. ALC3]|uniref:hypothetical protein n=1 Tax=Alicyclobacillus sp. ALC3 TaxID=2796143 RepID=UPI0023791BDC|nr:hypothetical protein [Alicyclobacillus sp. ALC3]WDL97776.1 hypothetical protein JC200_03335 [Alicyclobacillus sp. ALC3]